MERGEIWWTEIPAPFGSEPGFRRPVLVVQSNDYNVSNLQTVIGVAVTRTLTFARLPGNVLLLASETGLPEDSVANVSQIVTLDRRRFTDRIGRADAFSMAEVDAGLRQILAL
jgi:mRNA interferase MazF